MNVHLSKELLISLQAMLNKLHNMQSKLTFSFHVRDKCSP